MYSLLTPVYNKMYAGEQHLTLGKWHITFLLKNWHVWGPTFSHAYHRFSDFQACSVILLLTYMYRVLGFFCIL